MMSHFAIVNLKHEPGAIANGAVLIDRRTKWGNPFRIGRHASREQVITRYSTELWRRIHAGDISMEDLAALHGKTLACWCAPLPCHGLVLASRRRLGGPDNLTTPKQL